MKPYYRLLMRGNNCVGVAVGVADHITLISEISGRKEAIDSFTAAVPKSAENSDEWFYALNDLLPMTYKIGKIEHFPNDDPHGANSEDAAEALAAARIIVDHRSSRLSTTRVIVTAEVEDGGEEVVGSRSAGKLKGRAAEDEALAAAVGEEAT